MFRSKSELYEARIADIKEAHEARVTELMRLVATLADQVEFERSRQRPDRPVDSQLYVPSGPEPDGPDLSPSEEAEQIRALHEYGHIDGSEMTALLASHGVHLPALDSS